MSQSKNTRALCSRAAIGCLLTTVLLGASTARAIDSSVDPSMMPLVEQLGPVFVQGRRNPLVESDRRRHAIEEALPSLGTGRPRKSDVVDDFLFYYRSHNDPNQLPVADQAMLLKMSGGNPDDAR